MEQREIPTLILALTFVVSSGSGALAAAEDDRYRFAEGASEETSALLTPTPRGVEWKWVSPREDDWDTAFLGVRIAGSEKEPSVEIAAGTTRIPQHLDPYAVGLRWLNLTGLRGQLSEGASVAIEGKGVTLEPGEAKVRVFSNRLDLSKKILIVAPHPDDAELAAFGLYAGRQVTIVTVTSGNAGDFNYRANVSDPAEHYKLKGYLRAVDSVTVPWQGGVPPERAYNLGYFDARLEAMRASPDEPVAEMYGPNQDVSVYRRANLSNLLPNGPRTATWSHLIEDLREVVKKVDPAVIVMPHPLLDSHRDHQVAAAAVVEALERSNEKHTFLLYTNHASENRYPFGPAGTSVPLPPWSAGDIEVEGMYSHPVPPELQVRKLFALESMHDLRLSPDEQSICHAEDVVFRPDYPRIPEVDYFRRGVRSEELFFVHTRDGVQEQVQTFLRSLAELETSR
ncbi:MAG TPA: PIG-L family deacetylase [Vicinamibacteria bacterium]